MNLLEPVSGRKFAEMVGQSEGAVRKASARQSILKGKTADGKYIPSVASAEWGKPILEKYFTAAAPEPKSVKSAPPPKEIRTKKEKKEPETADEFLAEIMSEPLPRVSKKEVDADPAGPLDENSPKAEAERKTAIYKAKMAELAYNEKKGNSIPKDKVKNILFAYGQEIRVSMEGMCNRVLDRILATDTRHEAKRIFDEEIHETLVNISEIINRKHE